MLSNSLGSTMQMWEPQMKALTQIFRVIRYDRAGTASRTCRRTLSMERFGRDVLAILDDLNISKTHGAACRWRHGRVNGWGQRARPVRQIILANTACHYPIRQLHTASRR